MDNEMQQFTREELDVIFHVMNNSFDESWERAVQHSFIDRDEFVKVYVRVIRKLVNM